MQKIPSLDGLRAVSILLVVLYHASDTVGAPEFFHRYSHVLFSGSLGVYIFFVISGFLITSLLLREKTTHDGKIDIKKFYQRRFLRILPVCYLYIFVIFLLNKVLNLNVQNAFFLYAITYTINFVNSGTGIWALGHLWTLAIEEQFYLFWPWVTKLSLKKMTTLAWVIIIYAPLARIVYFSKTIALLHPKLKILLMTPFFKCADFLMIGCLLAISQYVHPDLWKTSILKNRYIFLLAIFLMWFLSFQYDKDDAPVLLLAFGKTIVSFCIAYVIASTITVKNNTTFKFLNHPLMVYIGVLSYSIYIWQEIFLFSKEKLIGPAWWFQIFPINIGSIFIVSILSYHLWERTFLKMKERLKVV